MFKLSPFFIVLLAGLSSASPAIEMRGPPETDNTCNPNGLSSTANFFLQSSGNPSLVWQAEGVTSTTFGFIDLVTKANASASTQARDNQLWTVQDVNHGNFAFVSAGITASEVCANGDAGPLDPLPCPLVSSGQANQSSQFFVFCQTCNTLSATHCQIQGANDGQCVFFFSEEENTIILDDCSSHQPNQFWDIVSA